MENKSEAQIQQDIQIAWTKKGGRLFRNNVGLGWIGKVIRSPMETGVRLYPGDVLIRKARPLHAGLNIGSGDLIGWEPVTITPEMVGKTLAVFASIEVKDDKGRVSDEQNQWMKQVNESGGIAKVLRSASEV